MSELHRKGVDERELDTVLAEDFSFEGELRFTKPLMIKGPFRGDIKADGELFVGEKAKVEARVEAAVVDVRGEILGNIIASQKISLHSTARVEGDMTSPDITMESGSRFNGICTMPTGVSE